MYKFSNNSFQKSIAFRRQVVIQVLFVSKPSFAGYLCLSQTYSGKITFIEPFEPFCASIINQSFVSDHLRWGRGANETEIYIHS